MARRHAVHYSSARTGTGRDDWRTPAWLVNRIKDEVGPIALDPFATQNEIDDTVRAPIRLTQDAMATAWEPLLTEANRDGLVYCNPPYSKLKTAAHKIWSAYHYEGLDVIALVPARTDTTAWQTYLCTASAILFFRGRLTFEGAPYHAPFPSALCYWGGHPYRVAAAFKGDGWIVAR